METKESTQREAVSTGPMDLSKSEKHTSEFSRHNVCHQSRLRRWMLAETFPTHPADSRRVSCWRVVLLLAVLVTFGVYHISAKIGNWLEFPEDARKAGALPSARQPNFLFIMTDDQDSLMGSLDYMPKLQAHMVEEGTTYTKHFCTVSIVRISLLHPTQSRLSNVVAVLSLTSVISDWESGSQYQCHRRQNAVRRIPQIYQRGLE